MKRTKSISPEHPFARTLLPLDLAKRLIEQHGATWDYSTAGPFSFLEVKRNGMHLGVVLIADAAVRFLDVKGLLTIQ